jgi:pimeloyl-ACP methyl ester carboxylesterase
LLRSKDNPLKTLWVFRYYDLDDRDDFKKYGAALVRLIEFIRILTEHKTGVKPKVNIIAHSMGGLIVREAVQRSYPKGAAAEHINKIITLGTPHKGISFQVIRNWIRIESEKELEHFNPDFQGNSEVGYRKFSEHFPPERTLTVVGTNYRSYGPVVASWLNRAFSVAGEYGPNYNRSDGLVKQQNAQLPGAPRTFIHKCHGGFDSLVTSREAFEISTRFLFGNIRVRLRLVEAEITRGFDVFGKSEFFFGVSIKPRAVDFELFHQSAEAENCYGPFQQPDLSDPDPAFGWAGEGRLIWEGWLNAIERSPGADQARSTANEHDPCEDAPDIVMRLDVYVGERDLLGFGFSDNIVFRKQYYVRAVFDDLERLKLNRLELHATEKLNAPDPNVRLTKKGWEFPVGGTGFKGKFELSFALVPETGPPYEIVFDETSD